MFLPFSISFVCSLSIKFTFIIMGFHKSTLDARGADMQLDPSCVSAPLATKVDLFAYFAERLFKSSFSYI